MIITVVYNVRMVDKTKKHGNTGKRNAEKQNTADKQLQIRISSDMKSRFSAQAERENKKLSEWALSILSNSLDSDLKNK